MEEEEDSSPGNNNSQLHNLARLEFKFNAGQKGDLSLNTEVFWHLVESFSYSSSASDLKGWRRRRGPSSFKGKFSK